MAVIVLVICWFVAELFVVIKVAGAIGVLATLLLLILGWPLGAWALREQGRTAWRRLSAAVAAGRSPEREVLNGVLVLIGGLLLILPGFISDVLGALAFLPPTRALLRRRLAHPARLVPGRLAHIGRLALGCLAQLLALALGRLQPIIGLGPRARGDLLPRLVRPLQDLAAARPQAAGQDGQVEHHRGIGEGKLAEVDCHVALRAQRAHHRRAATSLR